MKTSSISIALVLVACGGGSSMNASIGSNGVAVQTNGSSPKPATQQAPATPNGPPRTAQSLPSPTPNGPCVLSGTRLGDVAIVAGGKQVVNLQRIFEINKATLQLSPGAQLGIVSAETDAFAFHGEAVVDKVTVYPKSGTVSQSGIFYRPWSHFEPGSARADGKVSLTAATMYPWFQPKKPSPTATIPVLAACSDLSLSSVSKPAHWSRSQGGAYVKADAQIDFRELATGPATARLVNANKGGLPVDVLLLGKTANGKLTQVDFRVGDDLNAVGWLPSNVLTPIPNTPNVVGPGTDAQTKAAIAAMPSWAYRKCNMDVPLWVVAPVMSGEAVPPTSTAPGGGKFVEFGRIKMGKVFRGALAPNGDFRVDLGDSDKWSDKVPSSDALDPFVSKESLVTVGCEEVKRP